MAATIFAPVTSLTKSGICVVRISGEKVVECLSLLGIKNNLRANEIKFCKIYNPQSLELLDEALISFFKAPNSFTGQDVAEINIHASPFILKKLFEVLASVENVRMAEAGEFSKIAFLNGKIDLVQAEAIVDLVNCETQLQHRQALKQLQGELGLIYENWRFKIIELLALIESCIDFPDEDLPQEIIEEVAQKVKILQEEISLHLNDNKRGQKIKDGLSLAIIGAPNVGKSSLLNFLAKSEVAIVSEIAGTTRDIIEINLDIAGVAIKIADTAGLRKTSDKIEQEGIKRAYKKAENADLKILLLDASNPDLSSFSQDLINNAIIVLNKIDLLNKNNNFVQNIKNNREEILQISLKENVNTNLLLEKLEEKVLEILPNNFSPLITQERYRQALNKALQALENFSLDKNIEFAAEDLRIACNEIAKITGRISVDDILDVVFSKFCIGK